ncbi:Helicase [Lasiodiplodia theobromae]|uniref:Helicase n=1 Tax=Lasiodiplodia theobromae TaxID=45133 RepID=A0A8H7ISU3_9PEZI|nr:Helicase [Lasiodiplodia theobromae]
MMEQVGVVAEKRLLFRASSTDWHRFLGFQSAFKREEPALRKRKRCTVEDDADEERLDRWARLKKGNAKEQLKKLMGKEC